MSCYRLRLTPSKDWEINTHRPISRNGQQELGRGRIAGVNIPTNKRVIIALQYIHGIGPKKASEIMEKIGFRTTAGFRSWPTRKFCRFAK